MLLSIASAQAQSMGALKEQRSDELIELRDYCNKLESRSDDDLLIGRLQRQLMSTKKAYKAFIRKYLLTGTIPKRLHERGKSATTAAGHQQFPLVTQF